MLTRPEAATDRRRHTTRSSRVVAGSAALMYASAALLSFVEGLTPGGASFAVAPGLAAGTIATLTWLFGRHLSLRTLVPLGPLGAALIAYALTQTPGPGDGAVLYFWPVMWTSYFYGRRGAIGIVAWVAVVHALALHSMPAGVGYADRWIDVVVVLGTTATVINYLRTREEELVTKLHSEARTDAVTGLLNRRGFDERVSHELALAARNDWELTVITFDIDRFKSVNDEWGHEIGDAILATFGRVLLAHSRATDLAARVGGEEFIVLLPDTSTWAAFEIAERVRAAFADASHLEGPVVTVSAGLASGKGLDELEPLLREADYALYAAKREGRNRTVVHELDALA